MGWLSTSQFPLGAFIPLARPADAGTPPNPGGDGIITEGGDFLITESDDFLITES